MEEWRGESRKAGSVGEVPHISVRDNRDIGQAMKRKGVREGTAQVGTSAAWW